MDSARVCESLKKIGTMSLIHPIAVLTALLTYRAGHGVRGHHTWTPVPQVIDALDAAFERSFSQAPQTNKRPTMCSNWSRCYSALQRPRHQSEFQECESHASRGPMSRGPVPSAGGRAASCSRATSSGGGAASWSSATSASIFSSCRHGSWLLAMFQLTTQTTGGA